MTTPGPSHRVTPPGPSRPPAQTTYERDLLALVNQFSLDDMDALQASFTRKTNAGEPLSDHDVAMNELVLQARALSAFNQDWALAQRIAVGEQEEDLPEVVQAPRVVVPTHVPVPVVGTASVHDENQRHENQGHGDGTATERNETMRNENQKPPRNATATSQTRGSWLFGVVDWALSPQPVPKLVRANGPTNTSTAPKAPVINRPRPTGHDCVICQDPIYDVEVRVPCGHYYDIGCITNLFQSATKDETLYPPRCCKQIIPFTQVRTHLSQALATTFQEKQAEFTTLKRVYCASPTCSRFLGPLSETIVNKVYTCTCKRLTCGHCREQHTGDCSAHVCRPDAGAIKVLELSRASGWVRCPGCSQMIEFIVGCYHMKCRCRTEFCYLCRARWKACSCPLWDERRLLLPAQ